MEHCRFPSRQSKASLIWLAYNIYTSLCASCYMDMPTPWQCFAGNTTYVFQIVLLQEERDSLLCFQVQGRHLSGATLSDPFLVTKSGRLSEGKKLQGTATGSGCSQDKMQKNAVGGASVLGEVALLCSPS